MASLIIPLNADQLAQIMRILASDNSLAQTVASVEIPMAETFSAKIPSGADRLLIVQQFRQLLRGSTEKLVRFVVENGQEFFNDQLAKELEFDNPAYTSSVLGKITGKLRRVGVKAEGHRHMNWYTTHKEQGRTLLRIRPDVLEFFREALE
jgi:hypothetical protein